MRGKIISQGVIVADDGTQYSYDISQIKGSQDSLIGSVVDFEASEGMVALNISIVQNTTNQSSEQSIAQSSVQGFGVDITKVRNLGIILSLGALAGGVLGFGFIAEIIVIVVGIMLARMLNLSKRVYIAFAILVISQLPSIILAFSPDFIGKLAYLYLFTEKIADAFRIPREFIAKSADDLQFYIVCLPFFILGLFLLRKIFIILAEATSQMYFKTAYKYIVAGIFLSPLGLFPYSLGNILYIVGVTFMLYAWMGVKEFKKLN